MCYKRRYFFNRRDCKFWVKIQRWNKKQKICWNDNFINNHLSSSTFFFCPTKYFKDQSFFDIFSGINTSINDILYSSDEDETLERSMGEIVTRIKVKQKREFKEKDFIVLRNIFCKEESLITFAIHW